MARLARAIALDVPHHVTQRGNARRYVLDSDSDRLVYLDLLRHSCELYKLSLLGYCLMSNHVHLVVIPAPALRSRSLSRRRMAAMRPTGMLVTHLQATSGKGDTIPVLW